MNTAHFRSRAQAWWRRELRPLLILALMICAIRSSLADWNDVPTGSMKPTILEGDRVFVNKLAYDLKLPFTTWRLAQWANPRAGDIVVFYSPHDGKRLVKRVIGLPGDTIQLCNNRLVLNGRQVSYDRLSAEEVKDVDPLDRIQQLYTREGLPRHPHTVAEIPLRPAAREFGPFTVPEGQYFMMGDNRDDSFDSRYYGSVDRRRILGRATAVVASVDLNNSWIPRFRRFFTSLN